MAVRRFSVLEYLRLVDEGFFAADEQFELLDGWITPKMSRNPAHDAAVNRIRRRLERALPSGWILRIRSALQTPDSMPEPDIAVVRGDDSDYERRHPGPLDTAMVVEVANTSLAEDRGMKLQAYARGGVSCYWIANLNETQIEVYSSPVNRAGQSVFAQRADYRPGQTIPLPGQLGHVELAVADLFRSEPLK